MRPCMCKISVGSSCFVSCGLLHMCHVASANYVCASVDVHMQLEAGSGAPHRTQSTQGYLMCISTCACMRLQPTDVV